MKGKEKRMKKYKVCKENTLIDLNTTPSWWCLFYK